MKQDTHAPDHIAARTLQHYNEHAEQFREGTQDHDVSQNIAALIAAQEALVARRRPYNKRAA